MRINGGWIGIGIVNAIVFAIDFAKCAKSECIFLLAFLCLAVILSFHLAFDNKKQDVKLADIKNEKMQTHV